jgi:hypothetical protein
VVVFVDEVDELASATPPSRYERRRRKSIVLMREAHRAETKFKADKERSGLRHRWMPCTNSGREALDRLTCWTAQGCKGGHLKVQLLAVHSRSTSRQLQRMTSDQHSRDVVRTIWSRTRSPRLEQ